MSKPKPTIGLYNKPLFDKKIIEIYDPIHSQRYWFVKCKTSTEFTDILTKIIPNYAEKVEVIDDDEERDGECVDLVIDGRLVIIFWCNPLDANSLVHECLHAILFTVRSRGISLSDDESLCYMLGHLFMEILNNLGISLRKARKPKESDEPLKFNSEGTSNGQPG